MRACFTLDITEEENEFIRVRTMAGMTLKDAIFELGVFSNKAKDPKNNILEFLDGFKTSAGIDFVVDRVAEKLCSKDTTFIPSSTEAPKDISTSKGNNKKTSPGVKITKLEKED